jgi:hypothetical protein
MDRPRPDRKPERARETLMEDVPGIEPEVGEHEQRRADAVENEPGIQLNEAEAHSRTYTRAMPAETTLAAPAREAAAERFLRYVRIDTQSDEESRPTRAREAARLLRSAPRRAEQVGLADAAIDEHGYVTATLPPTVEHDVRRSRSSPTSTPHGR